MFSIYKKLCCNNNIYSYEKCHANNIDYDCYHQLVGSLKYKIYATYRFGAVQGAYCFVTLLRIPIGLAQFKLHIVLWHSYEYL